MQSSKQYVSKYSLFSNLARGLGISAFATFVIGLLLIAWNALLGVLVALLLAPTMYFIALYLYNKALKMLYLATWSKLDQILEEREKADSLSTGKG